MGFFDPELLVPVFSALLAGSMIGVERGFRARPAGFRTHALVCLASAFLMLAAVHQSRWAMATLPGTTIVTDPTRMAHGILTGIGFLCGGVIFKNGLSVHGLTTAASLWITAVLGILYGVAFYEVAVAGTIATLGVLIVLRWVDDRVPQIALADVSIRYRRDQAPTETELRGMFKELGLRATHVAHRLLDEGRLVEHATTLRGVGHIHAEKLSASLCADERVLEFAVEPRSG
ncbi:MAG TPA: MgtC/SapB family protein [Caulobacteraceae bacterium]|nr:MgtC/SapB family protein [Caulobacteraceae bacterium]